MNIALFEDAQFENLLPLTWLRMACELRCGRDRLVDKIRAQLGSRVAKLFVRPELEELMQERVDLDEPVADEDWCLVNARLLVTGSVIPPPRGAVWRQQGTLLAATLDAGEFAKLDAKLFLDSDRLERWMDELRREDAPEVVSTIDYPWDLIAVNEKELHRQCRDGGVREGKVEDGAHLVNAGNMHIEPGARIMPGAVLDAEAGPIYIDRDALIQPTAVLEGPCYIGRSTVIRPGATLRGATSIGPVCKVGGEIECSIMQGYANKQHDGYLGHSFVAEWVNLGADTVTSDLKNTYGAIRVAVNGVNVESGQQFLGAFIGDHAKTGIGTILPTGGVIGVAANVFTRGAVPKFVPSFAWLTDDGMTEYRLDKAIDIARTVMVRRDRHLSNAEAQLLRHTIARAREVEAAGWS